MICEMGGAVGREQYETKGKIGEDATSRDWQRCNTQMRERGRCAVFVWVRIMDEKRYPLVAQ